MLITHQREKLINAIVYFLDKTSWYGKTKLFKLLYFLDFEHYKETGRSVTGLDYFAWKMGPVPVAVQEEIGNTEAEADFASSFDIDVKREKNGKKTVYLIPKVKFDPTHFTKRELCLLGDIASRYSMCTSNEMIEHTHFPSQPWHQVWEVENRQFEKIPYEYVLADDEKEFIRSVTAARQEVLNTYS
jgi:uncharacterized phage-associated protein